MKKIIGIFMALVAACIVVGIAGFLFQELGVGTVVGVTLLAWVLYQVFIKKMVTGK